MRVQSFGDRRPDRVVWKDRQWQWASLRFEDGGFQHAETHLDTRRAREVVLPGDRRLAGDVPPRPGAGSLYWLGLRDKDGAYLDGGKTYKLTVPLPVPGKLFWSVTVYDAETRSPDPDRAEQGGAALTSSGPIWIPYAFWVRKTP